MSDAQAPPPPPTLPAESAPAGAPPPPAAPQNNTGGGDSGNRTLMLILSYLWPFALVPYLTEKDDEEIQWHAKNGLVMTAAEIVIWIVLGVVMTVLSASCIGCLFFWVPFVVGLGFFGLHVYCIHLALNGKRFEIAQLNEFKKHL